MRQRAILRRTVVALLLLFSVDTLAWAVACRQLEQGVRDAVATAQQNGWSLAAEGMSWTGWPFAAAIDVSGVSAVGPTPPSVRWQAERADLRLTLLHPTTLAIRVGGAQSVQAQGIPPIPFTAARAVILADLTGTAPLQASIAALTATLPNGSLVLDRAELTLPPDGVTADLAGLSLPSATQKIATIHLHATIDPPLPQAASAEASARAWRQAGGRIEVVEAMLRWDTLDAAGSGTITLDEQLQPQAEGTVDASGLPRFLDDLAQAGALAPAQAGAAKAVVAILAAPSGGERVQLPVSVADGVLRLARFPLLRFQPLVWH